MWLGEEDEAPLLLRAEIEFVEAPGKPVIAMQVVEWNLDVVSVPEMFDFFAPSDWERVDLRIAPARQ